MTASWKNSRLVQRVCGLVHSIPPIAWLLAGFFIFLTPHAYRYVKHHPDERHYTDAAIEMVESGDYLTPKTIQGELRLRKPILTYWMVASSYLTLGISPFASRLPFLLAGVAIIWLTYRLAWYLFDDQQIGLVAGLIVSCQPAVLISSPRSIPDIFLALGLLVSTHGFVRLLRGATSDWWSIGLASIGAALAVETKGLPAVVFVVCGFGMLLLFRRDSLMRAWKQYLVGAAVGISLGLSWFVIMFYLHGETLLAEFFGDQVVKQLDYDRFAFAIHLPQVFLLALICFLPWWLPTMTRPQAWRRALPSSWDPACLLLGIWCVVYLILASCVNRVNLRYQVPVVPLLSVLTAGLLSAIPTNDLRSHFVRLSRLAAIAVVIAALSGIGICLASGAWTGLIATGIICLGVIALATRLSRLPWQQVGVSGVLTLLLISPISYFSARAIATQSVEERLLEKVKIMEGASRPIGFLTKHSYPSRLRVLSGGEVTAHWLGRDLDRTKQPLPIGEYDVLVLTEDDAQQVDLSEFNVKLVDNGLGKLKVAELLGAVVHGQLPSYLGQRRRNLAYAVRRPQAMAQTIPVAHGPATNIR